MIPASTICSPVTRFNRISSSKSISLLIRASSTRFWTVANSDSTRSTIETLGSNSSAVINWASVTVTSPLARSAALSTPPSTRSSSVTMPESSSSSISTDELTTFSLCRSARVTEREPASSKPARSTLPLRSSKVAVFNSSMLTRPESRSSTRSTWVPNKPLSTRSSPVTRPEAIRSLLSSVLRPSTSSAVTSPSAIIRSRPETSENDKAPLSSRA